MAVYSIHMEVLQAVYPFEDSVSEDMRFDLSMKLRTKVDHATCNDKTENIDNKMHHVSYCKSIITKHNAINEEVIVDETLNWQSSHEQLAEYRGAFEEDKMSNSEAIKPFKECNSQNSKSQKCLSKFATFPSFEAQPLHIFCAEINGASSTTIEPIHDDHADELSTFMLSNFLPNNFKLTSAMKGTRAQNGTSAKIDMRVKWAEGIHDPPLTSVSHTVKGHGIQRTKPKKKDTHRHKNSKGKCSRGSNSGKKLPNRSNSGSTFSPLPAKLQAGGAKHLSRGVSS